LECSGIKPSAQTDEVFHNSDEEDDNNAGNSSDGSEEGENWDDSFISKEVNSDGDHGNMQKKHLLHQSIQRNYQYAMLGMSRHDMSSEAANFLLCRDMSRNVVTCRECRDI
jgi:hypothetical protein